MEEDTKSDQDSMKEAPDKKTSTGRPSAAAVGFSTKGMSLKQIMQKVENKQAAAVANEAKDSESSEAESSSSSPSSDDDSLPEALNISSCSEIEDARNDKEDRKEDEKEQAGIYIDTSFGADNIRRWTKKESKFPIPDFVPSKEARLKAIREIDSRKQLQIEQCLHGNERSKAVVDLQAAEAATGVAKEKKAKDAKTRAPIDLEEAKKIVPKHRRRTKSLRFLVARCFEQDVWGLYILYINILNGPGAWSSMIFFATFSVPSHSGSPSPVQSKEPEPAKKAGFLVDEQRSFVESNGNPKSKVG